jgi:hypothetical protein
MSEANGYSKKPYARKGNQSKPNQGGGDRDNTSLRVDRPDLEESDGLHGSSYIAMQKQHVAWLKKWTQKVRTWGYKVKSPTLIGYPQWEALRTGALQLALDQGLRLVQETILADLAEQIKRADLSVEEARKMQRVHLLGEVAPQPSCAVEDPAATMTAALGRMTRVEAEAYLEQALQASKLAEV